jgi:hypothetical protein
MFDSIVRYGCDSLCAPVPVPEETWHYLNYPQGFHALLAILWELLAGGASESMESRLNAYPKLVAIIMILATAMMVAGISSLMRTQRALVLPRLATVAIVTAYVIGPSASLFYSGFASFTYTCSAVVLVGLIAAGAKGKLNGATALALAALIITIANNWLALMPMAAAGLAMLWAAPGWAGRPRITAPRLSVAIIATAGCLGVIRAAGPVLRTRDTATLLETGGGIDLPNAGLTVTACALVFVLALAAKPGIRIDAKAVLQARLAAMPVLVGASMALALTVYLVCSGLPPKYYFWKFVWSLPLISVPLGCAILALGYSIRLSPRRKHPTNTLSRMACFVALTLAISQAFGLTVPLDDSLGSIRAPIARVWRDASTDDERTSRAVLEVLETANLQEAQLDRQYVIVGEFEGASALLDQFWMQALAGTVTAERWEKYLRDAIDGVVSESLRREYRSDSAAV